MRISRLTVSNFKGIVEFDQYLNRRFVLIVGNNGMGKTTLLDALSVGFGSYLLGIPDARARHIGRDEVREDVRDYDSTIDFIPTYPVSVTVEGELADPATGGEVSLSWKRELLSKRGRTTTKDATAVKDVAAQAYRLISEGSDINLPLLSYYGTGRMWGEPKRMAGNSKSSRFDAYKNSHEPRVSSADLLDWIERERLWEFETGRASSLMAAWKEAVEQCFDEPVEVRYSPSRRRIEVAFHEQGNVVAYENLSHGQRNILSMVGDIAFKATILNPHLGDRAVRETRGVVLIDEIDLHLHPRWQRKIIPALLNAFPQLQFIATTHSPFIVQSLREGSLLNLDTMDIDDEVYNLSIEDIAEEIQNIEMPQRAGQFLSETKVAEKFLGLIDIGSGVAAAEAAGEAEEAGVAEVAGAGAVDAGPDPEEFSSDRIEAEMDDILKHQVSDPALAAILRIKRAAAKKD